MSIQYQEVVQMETIRCGECGMTFGVPEFWINERRTNGGGFHCPNGHSRIFREPEVEQLRKKLVAANCDALRERNLRISLEEDLSKVEASKARLRKRVQNGVCPCCQRTFRNLASHMATKHPEKK